MAKEREAGEAPKGRSLTLDEVGEPGPIEKVSETEFIETAKLEAFMQEELKVVVAVDGTPGALPVVVITVNGKNQPIIRGRAQLIRRKYVEAMARSRITNYEQEVPDPRKPENIQMIDKTAMTYPFTVAGDSDIGVEWLNAILAQP